MSHPKNKKERLYIGDTKSKNRVKRFISYKKRKDPEHREWLKKMAYHRRNTTKTCSCPMCGNPRKWFQEKTRQEEKYGSGQIYPD